MKLRYRFNKLKKTVWGWLGLGILIGGLILGMDLGTKVSQLMSEATGAKADIMVDLSKKQQIMPEPWKNLAQGGEESDGMIGKTVRQVKKLSPNYIRIDHVYDYYEVVSKNNNQLSFNFSKLDKEIESILLTGAKPMLALSYMPSSLGPEITGLPDNWDDWQGLVRATINHYSGKKNKNIENIYYEVWNEPDLFGGFKTSGSKNYLEMYRRSALAAAQVKNVQPFKIGGPATTGMYKNWIAALLKMTAEENLRLDFVSWHRYSTDTKDFSDDVKEINKLVQKYPQLALKEKIISEWGFDSENNQGYDTQLGAAHMIAAIREMLGGAHKAFLFEIMDGKDPGGKTYWGRHGLLTHSIHGLQVKPRYKAFEWLNQIGKTRLFLTGEGSWVKGIAALDNQTIQVFLVNYDIQGTHHEAVPIVIKNLTPGKYLVVKDKFEGSLSKSEVTITQGTWTGQVFLGPNEIVKVLLKKLPEAS